jgi:hypothetical protein
VSASFYRGAGQEQEPIALIRQKRGCLRGPKIILTRMSHLLV